MFEKIFNLFFEKKKCANCLTVLKERDSTIKEIISNTEQNKQVQTTCLSEYFKNRKGLNMSAREKFFSAVFSAGNRQ